MLPFLNISYTAGISFSYSALLARIGESSSCMMLLRNFLIFTSPRPPLVYEILRKGSETARETAAQTMAEVKRAMRINYFEDAELIKSQSQKYAEK